MKFSDSSHLETFHSIFSEREARDSSRERGEDTAGCRLLGFLAVFWRADSTDKDGERLKRRHKDVIFIERYSKLM